MAEEIVFDRYKLHPDENWRQVTPFLRRNMQTVARYNVIMKQVKNGRNLLDVGCGDGYLTYRLSKKVDFAIGVDVAREAIKFASEKTQNVKNPVFLLASAYELPFDNDSFDNIVCADVVEHVSQPERLLAEIKRIWSGHGKVVLNTPIKDGPVMNKYHFTEYSTDEILGIMKLCFGPGFKYRQIKHRPKFIFFLRRKPLMSTIVDLLDLLGVRLLEISRGFNSYLSQTIIIEVVK